jgi:ferredoxin-NADP reductase
VRKRLDGLLGRVTMYRLVLLVLAGLVLYSILLDVLGWLDFGVPAMLASLAVTTGVCWGVTVVLARLFRTRAHTDSSLVTGLLIYFLFWPTLVPVELASLALAAGLAAASKFLLAVRGRHLFNPAAIAAVLVGLTGLNVATWWPATGPMFPAVLLGVLLVLYRTGKFPVAAVFLAVSTAIILVQLGTFGTPAGTALREALISRPGLFLAGFMLTEPLTLPPRRRQQLGLAAVVAVLYAVPFSIGPLFSSPELALVLGNLVAFVCGQRRGLVLSFTGQRELTPTSREFHFSTGRPVRFRAGQYVELSLPGGNGAGRVDARGSRRIFSLTSDPHDGGHLSIGLRLAEPSSSFKRSLLQLQPGDTVRATTVGGDFVLPDKEDPVLLLAGGVGITPFISQLRDLAARRAEGDVVLIYAVSTPQELGYRAELQELQTRMPGLRILVLASEDPGLDTYLGPGYPTANQLRDWVPDLVARTCYVSGSPGFVADAKAALRAAGQRRVRTDTFLGY